MKQTGAVTGVFVGWLGLWISYHNLMNALGVLPEYQIGLRSAPLALAAIFTVGALSAAAAGQLSARIAGNGYPMLLALAALICAFLDALYTASLALWQEVLLLAVVAAATAAGGRLQWHEGPRIVWRSEPDLGD